MDILYCPWRAQYVEKEARQSKREETTEQECVFCNMKPTDDEKNLILRRFEHFLVMINHYPYNAGHLLIISHDHKPHLSDFSKQARVELIELSNASTNIVKQVLKAEGVNIGINLGKAAGAGIPSHFHLHVLPRWIGDANFMPLLAKTKQVSVDLHDVYKDLKPHFDSLEL